MMVVIIYVFTRHKEVSAVPRTRVERTITTRIVVVIVPIVSASAVD